MPDMQLLLVCVFYVLMYRFSVLFSLITLLLYSFSYLQMKKLRTIMPYRLSIKF